MEGNGDNTKHGADRIDKTDVETPESRAAKQFAAGMEHIASRVRERFRNNSEDDPLYDLDYNGLTLVSNMDGSFITAHLGKRDDETDFLEYGLRTNSPDHLPYLPGYDYRLDVTGRHTDLETLSTVQEYKKAHPERKRSFDTSYFFNSSGEYSKVSTVPNDAELKENESMEKFFTQDESTFDAQNYGRAIVPMAAGDFEQAGYIIGEITDRIDRAK